MAPANVPLSIGAALAGAVMIDYGVKNITAAFNGTTVTAGASDPGATAADTGSYGATSNPDVEGKVTHSDLAELAQQHGWSASDIEDWFKVIAIESGGNPNIVNKKSGAAGIAQFIDGFGEYAKYGGSADSVIGQLTSMANYIEERYGSPSAALQHEYDYGWY